LVNQKGEKVGFSPRTSKPKAEQQRGLTLQLSLSNGIFSKQGVSENFEAVKKLGFKTVEFNMKSIKKEHDTDVYREQRALKASGLICLTHHSAVLHVKDPIEVHQAVYYGKISLECAKALGAPLMTVHSNISKKLPREVRGQCLREVFNEIIPFAKHYGIKLSLENLSFNSTGYGKNVEQLEEILSVIDPKSEMGITFDLCHALETNVMDSLLDHFGSRVCNVHMANKSHEPFTQSTPELTRFLDGLHGYGYKGPITLELAHDTTIEQIAQTKLFFDRLLKKY
jgi:sugar phosphate isomerase/epimerase